jgi:hypothetical protein
MNAFNATEFLSSDVRARVKMCREEAHEAAASAASASNAESRFLYLELMAQWNRLAYEIERRHVSCR